MRTSQRLGIDIPTGVDNPGFAIRELHILLEISRPLTPGEVTSIRQNLNKMGLKYLSALVVIHAVAFNALGAQQTLLEEFLMPPGVGSARDENRAIPPLKGVGGCPSMSWMALSDQDIPRRLMPTALLKGGFSREPKQKKLVAQKTTPARAYLLIKADTRCRVSLDGGNVVLLLPHNAKKVAVGLGEHVVMAMDNEGEVVWRKRLSVQSAGQTVVNVKFGRHPGQAERAMCNNNAALMWTRMDNQQDMDWHEARSYCEDLNWAGHTDWRLPTIDELQGLYDPSVKGDDKIISPFHLSFCCMWSSTNDGPDAAFTFYFNINEQNQYTLLARIFRVLCVRCSDEQ